MHGYTTNLSSTLDDDQEIMMGVWKEGHVFVILIVVTLQHTKMF